MAKNVYKKRLIENLLPGGKEIPEDGGDEVEGWGECQEGLKGAQPLHEVAGSYGADYCSKCTNRVCNPYQGEDAIS